MRRSFQAKGGKKAEEERGGGGNRNRFPPDSMPLDRRKASRVRAEITMVDVEISWNEPLFLRSGK